MEGRGFLGARGGASAGVGGVARERSPSLSSIEFRIVFGGGLLSARESAPTTREILLFYGKGVSEKRKKRKKRKKKKERKKEKETKKNGKEEKWK